jgi:hypothetical protein
MIENIARRDENFLAMIQEREEQDRRHRWLQ